MRKLICLTAIFLIIGIPSLAWGYKWSQLGRAPLMPSIEDRISLQGNFSSYRTDIIEGLRLAEPSWGSNEVFESLEEAIRSDRVAETAFSSGQSFLWMIFKPRDKVGVVKNVGWAGKEQLEGFLVSCTYRNEEIKFFIAKKCGNLALLEKKLLPVKTEVFPKYEPCPSPPAPTYVYSPPPIYYPPPMFIPPFPTIRMWTGWTGWSGPMFYYSPTIRPPTVRTVPPALGPRPPAVRTR